MKEFTSEEIQQKFETLPESLREAISSPTVHDSLSSIGERNELMIDQIGVLVDQVGLVLLGLVPGSSFVDRIIKEVGISREKATKISDEINTEILSRIKTELRKATEIREESEQKEQAVKSFEKAGGFDIEKEESKNGQQAVSHKDKEQILSEIENPEPSKESKLYKETFTEPLVDQLLGSSTSRSSGQESQHQTPQIPPNLPVENKNQASTPNSRNTKSENPSQSNKPDVYREPID